MKGLSTLLCGLIVLPALTASQSLGATEKPRPPSVDPKAKDILRQMSDYLGGLDSFRVHVETTREVVLPSAQELDSDQAFDLEVQRPDHLRADVRSAAGERQFFYDGRNVTIYTSKLKYYAVFPAPRTLDGALREAASRYGLELPAADLIFTNPYQALTKGVVSGMYVGESLIDGTNTHQLAFRQKNTDWQIWIEDGPAPLPRKLVITDRARRGTPRFVAVFSDWEANPPIDASVFTFVPQPGDRKISIRTVQELRGRRAPQGACVPNR